MAESAIAEISEVTVRGVRVEFTQCGRGRDILFLPSGFWLAEEHSFIEQLSKLGRVIAPTHPGFGDHDAPAQLTSVDDIAYLYLDLMDELDLQNVLLVGASFGGWVAAEMMVKGAERVESLALLSPFGVKAGAREERAITDIFATPDAKLAERTYVNPGHFQRELKDLDDRQLGRRVRSREALARYGWSPYMHDPKLPGRLHRVMVRSIVLRGAQDGMVSEACCRRYAESLSNAEFSAVKGAAHLPHVEQPEVVISHLSKLLAVNDANQSTRSREAV